MPDRATGIEPVDDAQALRAIPVQVHGDVDAPRLQRQRMVEAGGRQQRIDTVDQRDDRRKPLRDGENEAIPGVARRSPRIAGTATSRSPA